MLGHKPSVLELAKKVLGLLTLGLAVAGLVFSWNIVPGSLTLGLTLMFLSLISGITAAAIHGAQVTVSTNADWKRALLPPVLVADLGLSIVTIDFSLGEFWLLVVGVACSAVGIAWTLEQVLRVQGL